MVVGTPPQDLSESIQQIKVARTPPRRAKEDDVTLLGPQSDGDAVANGHQVHHCKGCICASKIAAGLLDSGVRKQKLLGQPWPSPALASINQGFGWKVARCTACMRALVVIFATGPSKGAHEC